MSRRTTIMKGRAVHRIREGSRLMRTHETMVDLISGRHHGGSIMDVLSSGLLDLDFLRGYEQTLEDDLIYSDDDDDDDIGHRYARNKPLEPHPRIRQLTDEEAEKHAKELIANEELQKASLAEVGRRKERTERNKRKKLRKKEKKRLEKENAAKEDSRDEEQEKSDSSENHEEKKNISEKKAEESPESTKTENQTEEKALCDQNNVDIKEEKNEVELGTKKEDEENHVEIVETEEKEDVATINKEENVLEIKEEEKPVKNKKGNKKDLNDSVIASSSKSVQEETSTQRSARERKKEKNKAPEIQQQQQQSKEKKPQVVEKPKEIQKEEEKQEPDEEQKTTEPTVDEFVRKSRELAGIGNRLAASGQYEMAVKYFTDAIKYNPQEFKLFGNRSLCYERLQQCENALRDADLALCMQPNWIKGLFRKGKALCGLKRYYDASLIYKEVLNLESSSVEAMQELKRAQTLHLMEMGFSWAQSSEALKTHATLEEAVDALFGVNHHPAPAEASAVGDTREQPEVQMEEDDEEVEEWTNVGPTSRSRTQQVRESEALGKVRSNSQSPTPNSRNSSKPELFSIWVGSLAPTVTYITLHELFSRAGTVHGIKMLLEHQCAFVNYSRKEDCDRAIQCINGLVVEGAPLAVRYPNRAIHAAMGKPANPDPFSRPGPYKKECFFWRTTGCTRTDCTFKHVPENKNIDKDKFTSRLGNANM